MITLRNVIVGIHACEFPEGSRVITCGNKRELCKIMDFKTENQGDTRDKVPKAACKNGSYNKDSSELKSKASSGPSVLFLWLWNWFVTLPKTVTNLYADLKSGELLARFTLLDAMLQFFVAVATSCHPQEEAPDIDENKVNTDSPSKSDFKAFKGSGRTLRSRTADTHS